MRLTNVYNECYVSLENEEDMYYVSLGNEELDFFCLTSPTKRFDLVDNVEIFIAQLWASGTISSPRNGSF